jgi:uncharacterized membrane protein
MANEQEHPKTEPHQAIPVVHPAKNPMAFLAYLWVLILIPFLTDAKNDPFVKYHLKQGLILFIFEIIGWFVSPVIAWIPVVGWLIMTIWWLAELVLIIIGIMHVMNGEERELPIIGHYAKNFNF